MLFKFSKSVQTEILISSLSLSQSESLPALFDPLEILRHHASVVGEELFSASCVEVGSVPAAGLVGGVLRAGSGAAQASGDLLQQPETRRLRRELERKQESLKLADKSMSLEQSQT